MTAPQTVLWQGQRGPVEVRLSITGRTLNATLPNGAVRVACQSDDGDLVWCCPDDKLALWPNASELLIHLLNTAEQPQSTSPDRRLRPSIRARLRHWHQTLKH